MPRFLDISSQFALAVVPKFGRRGGERGAYSQLIKYMHHSILKPSKPDIKQDGDCPGNLLSRMYVEGLQFTPFYGVRAQDQFRWHLFGCLVLELIHLLFKTVFRNRSESH